MSTDIPVCSFCLGGETDIPPFGSIRDAEDLVHPCSTCSLTAHRKCLLDWFNSLSSDKLQVVNALSLSDRSARRQHSHDRDEDIGVGGQPAETRIHINISSQLFNQWIANLASSIRGNITRESLSANNESQDASNAVLVLLLASCPQCKDDIVFSMKRSSFLTLTTATRTFVTRGVQYGGLFLGFTSAVTGIVSMGYIGMTTCGLKTMDCLVPAPLLVKILSKKSSHNIASYSSLSQLLFGNVENYTIDNLEQALSKGLIDPFKFSRIPILPIVMYRMRSSSIISCLLGESKDISFNNWLTEFMITGYLSSLILRVLQNPSSISGGLGLLKDLNLWKTNNMISMLIPIRWMYDLLFRLTLNRLHFKVAMSIRPRDIANTLEVSELDRLEELGAHVGKLEFAIRNHKESIDRQVEKDFKAKPYLPLITTVYKYLKKRLLFYELCVSSRLPLSYCKLKLISWFHEARACINNDYSSTLLYRSSTMRCVTTVLWPLISSKVGTVIFKLLQTKYFENVPKEKLMLLGNIIGMILVVFVKDCVNLYLSTKKAKQLSQMAVLCVDVDKNDTNSHEEAVEDNDWITEDEYESGRSFPGGYPL